MRTTLAGIAFRTFIGTLIGTFIGAGHSQPLDLGGRVVQRNGGSVPGAKVELKNRGLSAITAADGSFFFNANSHAQPIRGRLHEYRLEPEYLAVDIGLAQEIRWEVFDGEGRRLGSRARRLEQGRHRIAWSEALPDPGPLAGLYFLKLDLGGEILVHAFFHPGRGSRGRVFAPARREGAAAKRSAALDSLKVQKAGYRDLVLGLSSYTSGDLGDLVLSETAEDGRVCARQSVQRTAEGVEVVFCEALFDPPPRLHLPSAGTSVYAAMTGGAFVTAAGARYPDAARNSSDPELHRHASALYKIEIRDGKVESFRPAVVFAESLFLAPLMGKAFEGSISKRTSADRYEGIPSLPVRIGIRSAPYREASDAPSGFQVEAVIANLSTPVTGADGTCLPALSSHGSQAPFDPGAAVLLLLGRHPSMHAFGDDELVFTLRVGGIARGSLMSRTWFLTPLDILADSLTPAETYHGVGHGAPGTIPMLDLRPVSGGGAACPQK